MSRREEIQVKKILFFIMAALLLVACSNDNSLENTNEQPKQKEVQKQEDTEKQIEEQTEKEELQVEEKKQEEDQSQEKSESQQPMTTEEATEIIEYYGMGENDELVSLVVEGEEIKAVVKLADNNLLSPKDLAVSSYSQASDEYLIHEGWEVLTIEFVNIGSISMNRSKKETNEVGDYFPTAEIEKNLN